MWSIRHRRFVPRLLRSACSVTRPNRSRQCSACSTSRSSRAYRALPALWPNHTEPTAHGVNHFWCTPPLLVWTTPRGVDHIWCAPLLAGTSTHFLAVATPSVILPHQHPFLTSNIHFRLQKKATLGQPWCALLWYRLARESKDVMRLATMGCQKLLATPRQHR